MKVLYNERSRCIRGTKNPHFQDSPIYRTEETELECNILSLLRKDDISTGELCYFMQMSSRSIYRSISILKSLGHNITTVDGRHHYSPDSRVCGNEFCNGLNTPTAMAKMNRGKLCYKCQKKVDDIRAYGGKVYPLTEMYKKIIVRLLENKGLWVSIYDLSSNPKYLVNGIRAIRSHGYNVEYNRSIGEFEAKLEW